MHDDAYEFYSNPQGRLFLITFIKKNKYFATPVMFLNLNVLCETY